MKIIQRITATLIIFSMMATFFQGFAAGIKGAMNKDGKLKLSDARTIMKIAAGVSKVSEEEYKKADSEIDKLEESLDSACDRLEITFGIDD